MGLQRVGFLVRKGKGRVNGKGILDEEVGFGIFGWLSLSGEEGQIAVKSDERKTPWVHSFDPDLMGR